MATGKTRYPLDKHFLETRGFRPEIQGLRALAVLLVVVYHIWFGRVSGGVDVFLFISAFLLSLSSIRKINEGKPLAPVKYWLHVFQRLLPAASVVIIATTIASFLIYAPSRMTGILQDAFATIFYYQNWHLAFGAVDYYANNAAAKTPFQHFWSLSMQGQIFFTWPLLFCLVALLVRKFRFNLIGTALLIFGSVWSASFVFSVIETYSSHQGFAYFDTRTRLWEFATGTLLALVTFKWTPPQRLRVAMGWLGVLGLVTCGFLLPVQQAFPGFLALWPLISGALVILAGRTDSPYAVDRFLTSKPLLKLGESSYALYLVHWPLFILYAAWSGKEHVSFIAGLVLIATSIFLAWCLHTFVEQPVRKLEKKPARSKLFSKLSASPKTGWLIPLTTIASCLALVLVPLGVLSWTVNTRETEMTQLAATAGSADFPGALALNQPPTTYRYAPIPESDPTSQFDRLPACDQTNYSTKIPDLDKYCGYQNFGDTENAPLTMIVGDSHAEQAISVFRPIAEQYGLRVANYMLGGCHFPQTENVPEECAVFNQNMVQEILEQKPANVLLMATQAVSYNNEEFLLPQLEDAVQQFTDAGINVLALRDNPRYATTMNMYECAQNNLEQLSNCAAPVTEKLAANNPASDLIAGNNRVFGIDLTDQYCPEGTCQAVIGNIYVYIDDNHISKTYGSTTSVAALEQLLDGGWDPGATAENRTG